MRIVVSDRQGRTLFWYNVMAFGRQISARYWDPGAFRPLTQLC